MERKASTARSDLKQMLVDETVEPMALPLSLLDDITAGFSHDQVIGSGGFSVVYKGILGDRVVAVKRMSNDLMDEKVFEREVECLIRVRHKNVVRFLGYCADRQGRMARYNGKLLMADVHQRLLCFEYLPKGSVDKYINDAYREWGICYKIIEGICEGLQYLHENCIIHMDLKPANILLDGNMVPKIIDFGVSRCFDEIQIEHITTTIPGTIGYLAPELLERGIITPKADLYSLGVVILEILTGQRGYQAVEDVLESWSDRLERSQQEVLCDQIRVCYDIALECRDFIPKKRPSSARDILERLHERECIQELRSICNQSRGSKAMDVPAPPNCAGCSPLDDVTTMMKFDAYSNGPGLENTDSISLASPAETESVPKSSGSDSDPQQGSTVLVPSPFGSNSLADRMLMALSLFRESLGGGVLAQVWMPVEQEGHMVLSTYESPFLLDQDLAGFREVSRQFVFSAKEDTGLCPDLPGRVFISGVAEWTSNVLYYSKTEYLRMEYARCHNIRGSLAVPIYDPAKGNCCAVIELITNNVEKPDFGAEMDNLRQAVQAVNMKITRDCSDDEKKAAFTEILHVIRATCHAHMLPLALTWVPTSTTGSRHGRVLGQGSVFDFQPGKTMLSIHKSACYVNDAKMQGFFHACVECHLEKGQGIVGRALESNLPFFSPNIREYSIKDYPLVHHARKFGLQASVAIRLRSTYTGDADYILEFFLPGNCKGSEEHQILLHNLSSTLQRICKSLRTVSEAEVGKVDTCTSGSA